MGNGCLILCVTICGGGGHIQGGYVGYGGIGGTQPVGNASVVIFMFGGSMHVVLRRCERLMCGRGLGRSWLPIMI